jgi:transposase
MSERRLVGIDLGIASARTVRVLDGNGNTVAKRKAWPTVESLGEVEQAALAGCPEGTRLEVVVEPTGPAWQPIAVFFIRRGHVVHRVSSAKAADLRRFLSRHAKTNGIDADTLLRLPLVDPGGLRPLVLPGAEQAALDRRVRATDRLARMAAEHKVRLKDLARQLMPMSPLTGPLGTADLAVLERWADPRQLVRVGIKRLTAVIAKASQNHQGAERATEWLAAARAALDLYGDDPAVAFSDLAAEVASEVRLLRATQAELARHARERETCYRWVDPGALARSLPGVAEVGGPALVAAHGPPAPLRQRKALSFLHRPGPQSERDRPQRPEGPGHVQSRVVAAAHHPRPLGRLRPPAGPATRPDLLDPDGRTRQGPPWRRLCRGRQPGRTGLGRDGPRHALCRLRQRRQTRHSRRSQSHHRRPLDRSRRRPGPPTPQEGEGPPESPRRTFEATCSRHRRTGRPSPSSIVGAAPPPSQLAEHKFEEANRLTGDPT